MKGGAARVRTLWQRLDRDLFCQHRHPVRFFQILEQQGLWRVLWPTRLLIILSGVLLLPGSLWAFSGERWVPVATTVAIALLLFVSGFWMILSSPISGAQPGLWLAYLVLYHFSFPMLAVALVCGLAALTPVGLWVGWLIGLPLLLGSSFVDACSLAIYLSAQQQREKRAHRRPGGPVAGAIAPAPGLGAAGADSGFAGDWRTGRSWAIWVGRNLLECNAGEWGRRLCASGGSSLGGLGLALGCLCCAATALVRNLCGADGFMGRAPCALTHYFGPAR